MNEVKFTPEEQEENRKLWVEALRSGKYKQGRERLFQNNKYCCLGVLYDLASHNSDIEIEKCALDGYQFFRSKGSNGLMISDCFCVRNSIVRDFVGLTHHNGKYGDFVYKSLSKLNDDGKSFNKIADLIESKPEGLFCNA